MMLMMLPGFSGHLKIFDRDRYRNLVVECFVKHL